MPDTTLKAIKPWVKTFSAEIPLKHNHGDEVCVGGMVKSILEMSKVVGDKDQFTHITIDDDIGSMTLLIPSEIYDEIRSKHEIKTDMIVLAEGKIFDPKNALKNAKERSDIHILCWDIHPLESKE